MSENGKFRVEKFNDQNFSLWKMQMEDYLYQKDIYLPLSGKPKKPKDMDDEEWNLLDRKALGTIRKSRKGRSKSRSGIVCWKCRKKGNLKKDCRSRKGKEGDSQQEKNHEADVTGDVLQDAFILSFENITHSWVVDSGASFHATPDKKYFHDYVQGDFGQVRLGDDKPCKIVGMGKVLVKQQNGNLLKEVRHVRDLKKNLISTGRLGGEGCVTTLTDKAWKVTKGALVIEKGEKVGTLYLCNGISNSVNALTSKGADAELWHHRLGHISEKGMKILHSRNLFPGLKNVDLDFCKNCIYGKQKRVKFLRVGKEKKTEKLELVHTNVWGPTQVSSLGGFHYYVTFIDDATRKTWIYCIKNKSDVFDTFKKWKALVQIETGKKLKCLRSDNEGEYCSREFDRYC
eukprot:PITA_02476